MNGLNPMYDIVTNHQHEQDMRRAAEFRLIRDGRRRSGSMSLFAKFIGRMSGSDEAIVERVPEQNARAAS
jgi:hypothetical protein